MHLDYRSNVNSKNRNFAFLGMLILFGILEALGPTSHSEIAMAVILLLLNLAIAIIALKKKAYAAFIISFFMLSYSYVPFSYYILGNSINIRTIAQTPTSVYKTGVLQLLFQVILWWKLTIKKDTTPTGLLTNKATWPFTLLIILSLAFITFGRSGTSIIDSGGYKNTLDSVESTSFFAYSIMTIALAFIYANTRLKKFLVYILAFYFCAKNLLLGGRIETIQLCLALFLLRFRYIWSRNTILILCGSFYVLVQAWGLYRGDTSESLVSLGQDKFYITGGEVYYASMRIIYLMESGFLQATQQVEAFFYYFLSIVFPFSWLPDLANLSTFLKEQFDTGGGGLAPVFFYAFASYPAVIISAYLIATLINRMNSNKYYYVYGIFLLATWPRWYAYYPIQPIKFCLYALVLFWLCERIELKASKLTKI